MFPFSFANNAAVTIKVRYEVEERASRKLTFKIETVTKICKDSHISKFKNMGHRRYEHRINSRRTKRSESKRVVYDG